MCFLLLKFGINFALPQTPGTWFGGHGVRGEITNTELRTSPGEKANVVFAGTSLSWVLDRHKLTGFYLNSFAMDSVQVGKAVFVK